MNRYPPDEQQQPANTNRLRQTIDSGRTGDKVAVEDPSAAPLGTDDEAAGTTPSAEEVRLALAHEERPPPHRTKPSLALTFALIACVGLIAAAVAWSV